MRMRAVLPLIATAGLLTVAACSSHTYDRQAHEQALDDAGIEVNDLDAVVDAVETICDSDDMELTVLGMASNMASRSADAATEFASTRIHIEQVCPDRVGDFDDAVDVLLGQ